MERVLFARIAWMDRYVGCAGDDPWASGAGWVQEGQVPWECCNFLNVDGFCYGYSRPAAHADRARLDRIDPGGNGAELTGVRVIFFAPAPDGGQRIIGWYSNATVLAQARQDVPQRVDDRGQKLYWFFKCPVANAVLLPVERRTFEVLRGKGATGQSNWTFALDTKLRPKNAAWMEEAVEYTKREEARRASDGAGRQAGQGQGFVADALMRSAIEDRAMEVVEGHYRSRRFAVEDTHLKESYDFRCIRGDLEIRVEVKGTKSSGTTIRITSAEVESALYGGVRTDLAIVTGIVVGFDGAIPVATGGELRLLENWKPDASDLRPTEFEYRVPRAQ